MKRISHIFLISILLGLMLAGHAVYMPDPVSIYADSSVDAAAEPAEGNGDAVTEPVQESDPELIPDVGDSASDTEPAPDSDDSASDQTQVQNTIKVISITENTSKAIDLGTRYQIEVPGRKIRSCKSLNKKIVKVTDKGAVTTKKAGKTAVDIKVSGKKTIRLKLNVRDPKVPRKVKIREGSSKTITVGDVFTLTASVKPSTAKQTIKWTSSKPSIAKVDANGTVIGLKSGRVTITAVSSKKTVKADFELDVRRPETEPYFISHAMGGVGGKAYTNCLEGFEENYAEGHRIFEVDFEITSDNRIVLWHKWTRKICSKHKVGYVPTRKQFLKYKIFDKYTPLALEDLLKLMDSHPDIIVITDVKNISVPDMEKQYNMLVSAARKLGAEHVLDQIVPEVYNKDTYKAIHRIHHFRQYVFTLYKLFKKAPTKAELEPIASYCRKHGIYTIAMYTTWWKKSYMSILDYHDVNVALYTTNDGDQALQYFSHGVTALFTDFLPPIH